VNLDSDSYQITTVKYYDVIAVYSCCFRSYFAHFYYSLARCCLIAAVVAIDVFLKSFIIVSTHQKQDVASETGFKQDSPNPNLDSDSLIECSFLLNQDSYSLCISIQIL